MKMISRKQSLLVSTVLAVAGALFIMFLTRELQARKEQMSGFVSSQPHAGLPEHGMVHEFALTDAQKNAFESSELLGKVWVADFIFTNCPGICPALTTNMVKVQKVFENHADVNFVSFSVDPENDTPEVLSDYGKRFGADPERWHFLTGELDSIHRLAVDGFKVGDQDNPLIHSPHFVLVDRKGQIRGYYNGIEMSEIPLLIQDINMLLSEGPA